MNWTGHVLSAPRTRTAEVLDRPEAGRTGVYFLIGRDPDQLDQLVVYVGESDNVGKRLSQHVRDEKKDFWETTCVVTNKDANLTKAHVKFLESRLIDLVSRAGRAQLQNGNNPEYEFLPESDISDMEYILDQLQTLLPVLGFDFLRQTPQTRHVVEDKIADELHKGEVALRDWQQQRLASSSDATDSNTPPPEFYFSDGQGTLHARAVEIDGEMVVLAGSEAREHEAPSLSSNVRLIRQRLRKADKLVPSGKEGILRFVEDVAFSSPSAASQAVMATSRNGRIDWKQKDTSLTYAEWQKRQIDRISSVRASSDE